MLWRAILLSRARRRWRWTIRLLLGIPFVLAAAVVVLTHSPLTRILILPRVSTASGLHVDANWVHIRRDGTVVMDNVELTIPGVSGDPGRFLRIARLEAAVDWWSTLRGSPTIGEVMMIDPVLVVSQSSDDGSLNIGSIQPPGGPGSRMRLPGVVATNVGLELGEHGKGGYRALKRIQMDGSLAPRPGEPGNYTITLYEALRRRVRSADGSAGTGFTLGGTVSDGRIDLNLLNFSLSDWPPATLPVSIREISEDLALSGEVSSAHFSYTRDEGIIASMDLRQVAMNLPIEASVQGPEYQLPPPEAEPYQPPPARFMRMSGVDGKITFARDSVVAKVGGQIEDLPYEVSLRYDGVDENSAFNLDFISKDFAMSRNPDLLLYAPPNVKYYLKAFLMPTGIVTTNVNVRRGPPTRGPMGVQTGDVTVSGSIDFREGTAAYETFPYEFMDMTGRFEFDNDEVRIVSIKGRSKTGARLQANGRISPLDESSEVDVHVAVTEAQIDEAMEAAFGPGRGAVITALFNEKRHQELVDAGLIRTPEQAAAEAKELDGLEALDGDARVQAAARLEVLKQREQIAVFPFRGTADVDVHVYSPLGVNTSYLTNVDVFLPAVGLVPEKFPYPLIAENVAVEVRNQKGRLAFGTFRGVRGGRAEVEASFSVPGKSTPDTQSNPEIQIKVSDLPLDALLIAALPGDESGGPSPIKRILRDLGLSATGSGEVRIAARTPPRAGEAESIGFDASVAISSGEVRPRAMGDAGEIAIAGLSGTFEVSESLLFLDVEGVPVSPAADKPPWGPPAPLENSARIGGTLTVHVRGEFPPSDSEMEPTFFVAASCPGLDLSSPVESLVNVFSESAAQAVSRARSEFHPAGFVNVRTEAESATGEGSTRLRVNLVEARNLAADFLGGRATIPEAGGRVSLIVGENSVAQFEAVSGPLIFGGAGAGIVSIDGALPIGDKASNDESLDVSLIDGRFESALTRAILGQLNDGQGDAPRGDGGGGGGGGEGEAATLYSRLKPEGEFDASLVIRRGEAAPLSIRGRIEPRSLTLQPGDARVTFKHVGGAVEFEPGSGVVRAFVLEAPEWSVRADGAWTMAQAGNLTFRSSISARGNKLTDDLRAILPEELGGLFKDLNLTVEGPFQLSDATLDLTRSGAPAPASSSAQFTGRLNFADAGLEAGAPISNMNGNLLIHFKNGGPVPTYAIDLRAGRFEVAGITLTDGWARIVNGSRPGQMRIAGASGTCHGGRFHVRGDVTPDGPAPDAPRRFNATIQLAGARFHTILRELVDSVRPFVGPPAPGEGDAEAARGPVQVSRRDEFSRGLVDAELTLDGIVTDPGTRRGRATVRVSGGRVVNLPLVTGLIEAGNLQLPFNASLDYAWASMFIEGPIITFEDLTVQSSSIELSGVGTMTWPERELNLRLQSRSARPIPVLSDIIQGIRHQLMVTTVTGKLGEQVIRLQAPSPTRMLGGAPGEVVQTRESGVRRRAAADRERDTNRKRGIRPVPPKSGVTPGSDDWVVEGEGRGGP